MCSSERAQRAWFWTQNYAPEDFRYRLNTQAPRLDLAPGERDFLKALHAELSSSWGNYKEEKALHEKIYELVHSVPEFTPPQAFSVMYRLLINRDKGPKLAGFLLAIGQERSVGLLAQAL